jgi:hypothetical protein
METVHVCPVAFYTTTVLEATLLEQCCATMIWEDISPRMNYAMWHEEHLRNVSVLHWVQLSYFVETAPRKLLPF